MIRRLLVSLSLLWLGLLSAQLVAEPHVAQFTVEGPIGPATTQYLVSTMDDARAQGAEAMVIRMDTPGGLDAATRDIIKYILASPTPVITYVHPSGARAASAGTYILYASHIAAMTPATTLGAATPIQMGGGGDSPSPAGNEDDAEQSGQSQPRPDSAMERKVVNDAVAFIRGLANRHGRNADWAEQAVREAVSLTAAEALEQDVVDLVAQDLETLLQQADGREVRMEAETRTLQVAGLPVRDYEPAWHHELLALITNPQVAYILLLVGIYGLIFEGYNPGAMVPGVVGVVALLTAFYALQILPINYAGLALIIVGALLIAAEAFMPSFGVLGIGGVVALVIGSVMLMDTDIPEMMVSTRLIGAIGAVSSLVVLGILIMVGRSLRMPRPASNKALVGETATVVHCAVPGNENDASQVRVHGELWQARSEQPLHPGDQVQVVDQEGLTLTVTKEDNNHA